MSALSQARRILRLAQAASDAVGLLEKALHKEGVSRSNGGSTQKQLVEGEISELHMLFYQYTGSWPRSRAELLSFSEEMGFND